MSSPLASLSKIRRVPLQPDVQNTGRRSLPSRMKAFGEDEDDLSNDGLSSEERAPGPGCTREKPFHLGRSGSLPHDMGLVSSLVKRLTELEQKVKTQAEEINFKDQWIKSLKLKIKNLQPDEDQRSLTRTEELEAKCQHLQNQVHEMERFLNDYGLEWVGEPSETQMDMETDLEAEKWTMKKLWKPGESTVPAPTVNFDELLENLRDLSLLAGEGQSLVHTSSSMAMLKTPEPVPLTLYQNGIIMFNGPFRPFSDVSTQQCIQDILDGFFPSELKKIYPSGVPFQVTDLRNVVYQEKQLPNKVFSGPGYVVGRMNSKETKKLNDQSAIDSPLPFVGNSSQFSTISKEQFLKKLPKFVIRHGEVIEVREPIRETLEGCSGSQEILVETERLRQSSREIPTTTLRIKSENGEQTFVLPMSPLDTIGDVRRYLAQARDMDPAEFEIFTAFPPTVYRDDSKTLQACGLVPNAILLLRPPKTPHSAPSL
ncbi:UBX domain-containing protein 11 isoform X2 [Dromiciops gliroides]|uniref:UBX domain-containing protein 11 isoform X2 n=1 Tax=Dromiciops gliroides TaxID=33562 RepID=UPI001CC5717A|nr:UBX domain-containing protein 11 isoform X2 [Dromiciops gliroides]